MNPYKNMSPKAFWRNGVVEDVALDSIHTPKWTLSKDDCVVTMGSCFAQHVGKKLISMDFNVPFFDDESNIRARAFSANYGNIYTVRQALQLLAEANGSAMRSENYWKTESGFIDPYRPNVFEENFESIESLLENRKHHLISVLNAIKSLDVLVFTLGLTEGWEIKKCGSILPVVPGVLGGEFNKEKYAFKNFDYIEITSDLEEFIDEIIKIRKGDKFKLLLTVSPVPLTATAENRHVLVSSVASKSILRSVADSFSKKYDFIDYFPSFEIVTNPKTISNNFEDNIRNVKQEAVDMVMESFASSYDATHTYSKTLRKQAAKTYENILEEIDDADCEDALLDQFSKKPLKNEGKENILFYGNSHLGFLRNALTDKIKNNSLFVPINFLENKPIQDISSDGFQKFIFKRTNFKNIYQHECDFLVISGFGLMGDGILRSLGPLKPGYEGCEGKDITQKMPINKNEFIRSEKKFKTLIKKRLNEIKKIEERNLFSKILCVVAPDMPEKVARFRLGDSYVDSDNFIRIKKLYLDIFMKLTKEITPTVKYLHHDKRDLYNENGFVLDFYARGKPWDIHPNSEFYVDGGIVKILENELQ